MREIRTMDGDPLIIEYEGYLASQITPENMGTVNPRIR